MKKDNLYMRCLKYIDKLHSEGKISFHKVDNTLIYISISSGVNVLFKLMKTEGNYTKTMFVVEIKKLGFLHSEFSVVVDDIITKIFEKVEKDNIPDVIEEALVGINSYENAL